MDSTVGRQNLQAYQEFRRQHKGTSQADMRVLWHQYKVSQGVVVRPLRQIRQAQSLSNMVYPGDEKCFESPHDMEIELQRLQKLGAKQRYRAGVKARKQATGARIDLSSVPFEKPVCVSDPTEVAEQVALMRQVAKVVRVAEQRKNARMRRRKPVAVAEPAPAPVATGDDEVNALLAELQGSSLIGGYLRSMPSLMAHPLAVSGIGGAIGGAVLTRAQMLAEMKSWPQGNKLQR